MLGALGRKRPAKKKRDRKRRNATWKSAGVLSPRRSTPKLSPRQRRRAQYDDAERNPPPFPSSPLSHPSSLPRFPLSTSRRLSQWKREERRSIRVDVLCTMACLRERRALTPKVVLTRLHVLPRIDVALPLRFSLHSPPRRSRVEYSLSESPLSPPNLSRCIGDETPPTTFASSLDDGACDIHEIPRLLVKSRSEVRVSEDVGQGSPIEREVKTPSQVRNSSSCSSLDEMKR